MRCVRYVRIACLLAAFALVVPSNSMRLRAISKHSTQGASPAVKPQVSYLIARRELSDPLFRESVVLMLPQKDPDILVGLIVNKPTSISLHAVFPENRALKNRTDTVYFGGPVDTLMPGALFRSPKRFKQAFNVAGDLYVTFDSDFIEGILKHPQKVLEMRLFLGRSQWSSEQLQNEMLRRAWYSKRDENSWIFNPKPANIWRSFIERLERNIPTPIAWRQTMVPEIRHFAFASL
jgi:putative transcriptional regulator